MIRGEEVHWESNTTIQAGTYQPFDPVRPNGTTRTLSATDIVAVASITINVDTPTIIKVFFDNNGDGIIAAGALITGGAFEQFGGLAHSFDTPRFGKSGVNFSYSSSATAGVILVATGYVLKA